MVLSHRLHVWNSRRGPHLGRGHGRPHQQAGHMTAIASIRRCSSLAGRGPSTYAIQQVRKGRGNPSPWLLDLVRRKPPKLAAVALANKTARILWKLMVSGERYNGAEDRARARRGASLNGGCAPRRSLNTIAATMEA